jgi:TRAP-type C4-dicarboxylate transport system permease small subunit
MEAIMKTLSAGGPFMAAADGVDRVLGAICRAVLLVTLSLMLAGLGLNVVIRYVATQGGIDWINEATEFLFPWAIAAGIVLAVQRGAHIAVDVLFGFFGPQGARVLGTAIHLLVAVAYLLLLKVTIGLIQIVSIEMSPLLGISRSWAYWALAFGAGGAAFANAAIALRVALNGVSALPAAPAEESVT